MSWLGIMESGSIAFPSISTGYIVFPVELRSKDCGTYSCQISAGESGQFDLVEWVLFDSDTESVYEAEATPLL